jgi:hypothetical protein
VLSLVMETVRPPEVIDRGVVRTRSRVRFFDDVRARFVRSGRAWFSRSQRGVGLRSRRFNRWTDLGGPTMKPVDFWV